MAATPPTVLPPPVLPADPSIGAALTNYLTQFSTWARKSFAGVLSSTAALPGILLQGNDAPAGTVPNVYLLQISNGQVLETSSVPLGGKGAPGAPVPVAAPSLPVGGGTLTGPLILAGDPTAPLGAATKQYVDAGVATALPLAGGALTGPLTAPTLIFSILPVNAANDAAAATAGVAIGGVYRNGSVLMVRVT